MKLSGIVQDRVAAEARQSASKSSRDTGSDSPFGGILSKLGADGAKADPKATRPPADPNAAARAPKRDPDAKDAAPTGALDPAADEQPDATLVPADATIDTATDVTDVVDLTILAAGKAQAPKAAATDPTTAAATDGGDVSQFVDDLLRHVGKETKTDDASPTPGGSATAATAQPTDLMALLVGQAVAAPASAPSTPAGTATAGTDTPTAIPAPATSTGKPTEAAPATASETVISDLSVETHLASGTAEPAKLTPAAATLTTPHAAEAKPGEPRAAADIDASSAAPADPVANITAVLDGAPVRHIATAVVELAAATPVARPEIPDTPAKPLAIARTLTLQMQPADLGTVDIRLHVTGDTLDLQLKVSDSRTLGLVSRERDTLTTMLREQNYQVHSLVIQDAGAASSSFTSGADAGSGGSNPRADERRDPSAGQGQGQGGSREGQNDDASSRNPRRLREQPAARARLDDSLLVV